MGVAKDEPRSEDAVFEMAGNNVESTPEVAAKPTTTTL